jgi:DNA-binding NarL/FixJ family response regulator
MTDRLVIVADASVVVHALRAALAETSGFELVGELDGRDPIALRLLELRPGVVVIDDMRKRDVALARLRESASSVSRAKCVLLTHDMAPSWVDRAFDAGALAVLSKSVNPRALATLLRETVRGTVVHRPQPLRDSQDLDDCPLTSRELEVLGLTSKGMTNGHIARSLWLTEETVKFHLSNVYRKLGVSNRTEASHYAHVHGIVPDDPPRTAPRPSADVPVAA